MDETKVRKIRSGYSIGFSVLTGIVGILLIAMVCDIFFRIGAYSRETVIEHLIWISAPLALWIAAAIGGFVVWKLFPEPAKRNLGQNTLYTLYRLRRRMPVSAEGDLIETAAAVAKQEKLRKIVWWTCAGLCTAFAAVGLAYLLDFSHFPLDENGRYINREILRMVLCVFPWVVAAFLLCIGGVVFESRSIKAEIPHLRQLVARGTRIEAPAPNRFVTVMRKLFGGDDAIALWTERGVLFVVGVVFVVLGAMNGGVGDLFDKAVNICTECIGLG